MRINNNIPAMNTHRIMKMTNGYISKNMERLSSGLRINRAGDDAAGMSISEKMRAQIRGLHQAERNVKDGISLIQTAEGGLGEIQNPNLQRMRELVIQALNDGVLTREDKDIIQNEIDQIKNGIDDIANNTEFNTIKLLNGSNPGSVQGGTTGSGSEFDYENVLSTTPVDPNGSFTFATNEGYPTTDADNNQTLVYGDGGTSHPTVKIGNTTYNLKSSTTITSTVTAGGISKTVYNVDTENVEIIQSVSIVKDKYEIKYSINNKSGVDKEIGFMFHMDTMLGSDDAAPFIVDGVELTNETAYESNIPDSFILYNQSTGAGANAEFQAQGIIKGDGIIEEPSKLGIGKYSNLIDYNWTPSGAIGDSGYSLWWNPRVVATNSTFEVNTFYGQSIPPTIDDPTEETDDEGPYNLIIQTGPNEGNILSIELPDARTQALGIDGIKIDTIESAEDALTKIDGAISIVSSHRSRFGAIQNRLEHIERNIANYAENLQAAESRVRDVDMAQEMVSLSKYQILLQASQAMLAQTNQMTQGVLQLLK